MKTGAANRRGQAPLSLAFGLFLGLVLWKLGNPVILEHLITPPDNIWEVWPVNWGYGLLILLCAATIWFARWDLADRVPRWLFLMPLAWLAWQFLSATHTVDPKLTGYTLRHFCACVACFYLGFFVLSNALPGRASQTGKREAPLAVGNWGWLAAPLLLCFLLSLWMAFEQHYGGLEETRKQFFSQTGAQMYPEWYLRKMQSNRVFGSFVYPNALAGAILLFLPVSLRWTWILSGRLTRLTRMVLVGLMAYAGIACLYWSESKGGWLIALLAGMFFLGHLGFSRRIKMIAASALLIVGLIGFLVKFQTYLQKGATSVGARFGYWEAALDTARANPILGSGPGTFSVAYARIKPPEAEMARLAHNDYLEQACDSGILGFILYLVMIIGWLAHCYRRTAIKFDSIPGLLLTGLIAWCAQGLIEFQLYIPGLAWPVFMLFGTLLALGSDPSQAKDSSRLL